MSKIYEALKRVQNEAAEVALPVIAHAGGPGYHATAEAAVVSDEAARARPRVHPDVRVHAIKVSANGPVMTGDRGNSPAMEQYRIVRTRILQHERKTQMLLISSACPGDGKTVSAINLASVLSLRNSKVLLIDTDLRKASIAEILGLPDTPGLAHVLANHCTLNESLIRAEQNPNFYILTAGKSTSNPAELLDSPKWQSVCKMVREQFDFVLMDAPPVAAVADYELLQAVCDSVILVIRPDYTEKSMCMNAISIVPEEKLLGTILNCAYDWFLFKTHHSQYYPRGNYGVAENAKA